MDSTFLKSYVGDDMAVLASWYVSLAKATFSIRFRSKSEKDGNEDDTLLADWLVSSLLLCSLRRRAFVRPPSRPMYVAFFMDGRNGGFTSSME
jgi:hypothetical protein